MNQIAKIRKYQPIRPIITWWLSTPKMQVRILLKYTIFNVLKMIQRDENKRKRGREWWFKSSHRQNLYWAFTTINCIVTTKIKKKRAGIAHTKVLQHQSPTFCSHFPLCLPSYLRLLHVSCGSKNLKINVVAVGFVKHRLLRCCCSSINNLFKMMSGGALDFASSQM